MGIANVIMRMIGIQLKNSYICRNISDNYHLITYMRKC